MRKIIIIAVDIRSTHNVGAFFRTADGFKAHVVLTGITPRPIGPASDDRLPHVSRKAHDAIHKTALGAELSVQWRYYKNTIDAFIAAREDGYKIYAIEQSKTSKPISNLPKNEDIALVLGPEVTGLSNELLNLCDAVYEIPMQGKKESFNVSVAAGIALYQSRLHDL